MKKLLRIVLFSLFVLVGVGTLYVSPVGTAAAGGACVQDADCVSICGTTAPTGYTTSAFLCQPASAVGTGFNNKCVRLMAKGTAYANVPNAVYSLPCPL